MDTEEKHLFALGGASMLGLSLLLPFLRRFFYLLGRMCHAQWLWRLDTEPELVSLDTCPDWIQSALASRSKPLLLLPVHLLHHLIARGSNQREGRMEEQK